MWGPSLGSCSRNNSLLVSPSNQQYIHIARLIVLQAVIVAGICEFLGAVLLGANVADTIKSGIAKLPAFAGTPGMLCCKPQCFLAHCPQLT